MAYLFTGTSFLPIIDLRQMRAAVRLA